MPRLPVVLTVLGTVAIPVAAMAAWTSPPVDLSAPGQDASDTFSSVDAGGNTVAYWMRFDGSTRRAQAARRVVGTWLPPFDLSPPGVDVVGMASPAGGESGTSFAGWQSEAGGVRTSSVVTLRDGMWSAPRDLGSGPAHQFTGLRIAANASGEAVATWTDQVGGTYFVDLARYAHGAWSDGTAITDSSADNLMPRAVIDNSGVVTVAWWSTHLSGGGQASLQVMRSSGAGWTAPVTLTTADGFGTPALTVDGQETVTAAWQQQMTTGSDMPWSVSASRFVGGAWGAPVVLDPLANSDAGSVRAAADGAGNAFVTWTRGDVPSRVAKAAAFAGGTWDVATVSAAGEQARNPHIAAGGVGATVMWASGTEGSDAIRARRWADGAWGPVSDLSPAGQPVNRDSWDTQASNGSAVAIWLAPKGGNDIAQAVTFAVVPDAPAAPTVQPKRRSLAVLWTPPVDPGTAITYTATASPGGRHCRATSPVTACTITGLVNGRKYRVRMKASNSEGTSPASAPSAPVAPIGRPGAPRAVTATAGADRAAVTWRAPALGGGTAITGYVVQAVPGGHRCTTRGRTTCVVTSLASGHTYRFTVRARNATGLGPRSRPSGAVLVGPPGVTG